MPNLCNNSEVEKSDDQLVTDYLNGDEEAFSALLHRYLKSLYNFSFRLTNEKAAAEDVAQEAFVKVWKNISKYHIGGNFKTWIFTIARNATIDYLRKKKNIQFSAFESDSGENFFVENLADDAPTPEELFVLAEQKELVSNMLQKVSPAQREVLILHEGENMTFDEIGKILNKPLNTVKSQHRRALIELRKLLGEYPG